MTPAKTNRGMQARQAYLRLSLLNAQGGECWYCGRRMCLEEHPSLMVTVDHRRPLALGGANKLENMVGACIRCNGLKGNLTEAEFVNAVLAGHWRFRGVTLSERALASVGEQIRREQAA